MRSRVRELILEKGLPGPLTTPNNPQNLNPHNLLTARKQVRNIRTAEVS